MAMKMMITTMAAAIAAVGWCWSMASAPPNRTRTAATGPARPVTGRRPELQTPAPIPPADAGRIDLRTRLAPILTAPGVQEPETDEDEGPMSEAAPDPAAAALAAQVWNEAYMSRLERVLLDEKVDRAWASGAEAEARSSLGLGPGQALLGNECRETLCRLEVGHREAEGHEDLVAGVRERFEWLGAAIFLPSRVNGESRTLIYLARPGYELPQPGA